MSTSRPRLPRTIERTDVGPIDERRRRDTHVFDRGEATTLPPDHPLVREPYEPPRRPVRTLIRRTGWLVVLVIGATAAVLAVASRPGTQAAPARAADVASVADAPALLPAATAVLGLDTDSREAVLTLCWRVSDNPNTECRLSHLGAIGELPVREAEVPAFELDRFEVSNARWAACEAAGACPARDLGACRVYTQRGLQLGVAVPEQALDPGRPATCVTLDEARVYCSWRGGALPSADEWERAARGADERLQPWGRFWSPGLLNWGERDMSGFPIAGRLDGYELAAPVDAFEDGRSPEGVQQLLGNVGEWVEPDEDEHEAGRAGVRGGDYTSGIDALRATRHVGVAADERRTTIGFRCAYPAP